MDSSNPKEMAAPATEASEAPKKETSEVPKEGRSGVPKEKEESAVPPKAKMAKKRKGTYADIWVVKAFKQKNGDQEGTLIGAYSSKAEAIENAWMAMENFEGEDGFKDNSDTIGEDGGVVFSFLGDGWYSVSMHKVSLDKPNPGFDWCFAGSF